MRLGSAGGVDDILSHPWLKEIDPKAVLQKRIDPPMKPALTDNPLDISNFKEFNEQESKVTHVPAELQIKVSKN